MDQLKTEIRSLPTTKVGGINYLLYRAVTNQVAALLLPGVPADEIGGADYQHILETAEALCRELGYTQVVKLTPPDVPMNQMGLYWTKERPDEGSPRSSSPALAGWKRYRMVIYWTPGIRQVPGSVIWV
jgi:hypothetical protein